MRAAHFSLQCFAQRRLVKHALIRKRRHANKSTSTRTMQSRCAALAHMTKTGQLETSKQKFLLMQACSKEEMPGNQLSTEGPVGQIDLYSPFDQAGTLYRRSTSRKTVRSIVQDTHPRKQEGHMANSTRFDSGSYRFKRDSAPEKVRSNLSDKWRDFDASRVLRPQGPRCRQCHLTCWAHLTCQ